MDDGVKKFLRVFMIIFVVFLLVALLMMISKFSRDLADGTPVILDSINAKNIQRAISLLVSDTNNPDLKGLYDMEGKKALNIKFDDPESVKKLIIALQEPIFYKGNKYGPYLEKVKKDEVASYEGFLPQGVKNRGYRISIEKADINSKAESNLKSENNTMRENKISCKPVEDEANAVITFDEKIIKAD